MAFTQIFTVHHWSLSSRINSKQLRITTRHNQPRRSVTCGCFLEESQCPCLPVRFLSFKVSKNISVPVEMPIPGLPVHPLLLFMKKLLEGVAASWHLYILTLKTLSAFPSSHLISRANFKPYSLSQQHSFPLCLSRHVVESHILETYSSKMNIQKRVMLGPAMPFSRLTGSKRRKTLHSKLTGFTGPHSRGTYSSSMIASEELTKDGCYINLRDSWYCTAS